jgi:regulator of RNase E activity RraA
MRTVKILGFVLLSLFAGSTHAQTGHLTAAEAKDHVGEKATVCGKVVSARFAKDSKGQPTFLNLDEPYPNHIFTIVVWGSDRGKFGDILTKYSVKSVCVTGKISSYQGKPEIAVSDPSQIEIQK